MGFYCPEHQYNPPPNSGMAFCPRCELQAQDYPENWPEIAREIKEAADWRCVRCGHPHDPPAGYCLTVHHLDGVKGNCRWWNLPPLCQRCHLSVQGRVKMRRAYMLPHSDWFRPYVAGYYAFTLLGEDLTREEVEARLEELLLLGQPWLEELE